MKNKVLLAIIIIVYTTLIGTIIYFYADNSIRKDKLTDKVSTLETVLKSYYETTFDKDNVFGKLFVFPGETDIEFNDDGIISGEGFIHKDGKIEIALYDGRWCASKIGDDKLEIKKTHISDCGVNKSE